MEELNFSAWIFTRWKSIPEYNECAFILIIVFISSKKGQGDRTLLTLTQNIKEKYYRYMHLPNIGFAIS